MSSLLDLTHHLPAYHKFQVLYPENQKGILNPCFIPKISWKVRKYKFRLEMTLTIIWFNLFILLIRKLKASPFL